MAFTFTKFNTNHVSEFKKHSDLFKEYGPDMVYEVVDAYTMTPEQNHSEYGDSAIFIVTIPSDDGSSVEIGVNLPKHMVSTVRELNADAEARRAIEEGHLGFKIYEYDKSVSIGKSVKTSTYYGIELCDI